MHASFPGSRGDIRLFVARVDVSEINARTRTESRCEANGFVSGSPGVGADGGERLGRAGYLGCGATHRHGSHACGGILAGQALPQGWGGCADKEIRGVNAAC